MSEERRQNLAETHRESYYNEEETLEEFLDDKGVFYNGSESDDSDNDDENYNENNEQQQLSEGSKPGVVAFTCNPATLEAEFQNDVGLVQVGSNSPLIGGWIV